MNYRRHEAQNAAGALKLHQRGPIGIEAVEHFRVNRVSCLEALLVVRIAAVGREFLLLRAVKLHEGFGGRVAGDEQLRVRNGLEEPTPDNLETFLGAGRPP